MKRHLVSASGRVKVIRTTPLESEVNCGKKKAVSFRFLRAVTWLRSGFGPVAAPGAAPTPALSARNSMEDLALSCRNPEVISGTPNVAAGAGSAATPLTDNTSTSFEKPYARVIAFSFLIAPPNPPKFEFSSRDQR